LNADKWGGGLFGLKQHNFVTHRHFSIKLGGKKYILLFNNSIKKKFMQKFARAAEISTKFVGAAFCVYPVK